MNQDFQISLFEEELSEIKKEQRSIKIDIMLSIGCHLALQARTEFLTRKRIEIFQLYMAAVNERLNGGTDHDEK